MSDALLTVEFWIKTAIVCVHVAAGAALGVLGSGGVDTLRSVPWEAVLSSAGFAALYAALAAVSSATLAQHSDKVPERVVTRKPRPRKKVDGS